MFKKRDPLEQFKYKYFRHIHNEKDEKEYQKEVTYFESQMEEIPEGEPIPKNISIQYEAFQTYWRKKRDKDFDNLLKKKWFRDDVKEAMDMYGNQELLDDIKKVRDKAIKKQLRE